MARLTAVQMEVKKRLQDKVEEIKDQLPHRYIGRIKEMMEEEGLAFSDVMIHKVKRGVVYNKDLCVMFIKLADLYQKELVEKEEMEKEAEKLSKEKVQKLADEEMKKLGL